MKKLFVISMLLLASYAMADDKNIVSIVVGDGTTSNSQSSSSSSNSTVICNNNCKHSTTSNVAANSSNPSSQSQIAVGGLMYQRRLNSLVLGVLVQSNQTYSGVIGFSF